MKKLLTIVAAIALAGSAYAGCGVKVAVNGELTAYDAETKTLTIGLAAYDAETKTLNISEEKVTLDASATIKDAEGKDVAIDAIVGKEVEVSTDKHTKKAESVKVAA